VPILHSITWAMALFQQPVRPNGSVHVEFKAGRMDWDGKMVTADKRKGKLILLTNVEEQLMHIQWMDRDKNETGIDLIVINDAYFEKIEKCKDGRVFLLRFTSSEKKLFFWMQEPKSEKDEELIKNFNEAVGAKIPEKGSAPPSTGAPTGPTGGQQPIDPALRAILSQILAQQGGQGGPRTPPVPLQAVLTTEVLQGLMADEGAVAEMSGLLPPGQQSADDLRDALQSAQLQQAIGGLTQAVHSDQLPVLFSSLGLDPSSIATAAQGTDALELLVRAMEGVQQNNPSTEHPAPAPP